MAIKKSLRRFLIVLFTDKIHKGVIKVVRIINKKDWLVLERGLKQRLESIDLFLNDIYRRPFGVARRRL